MFFFSGMFPQNLHWSLIIVSIQYSIQLKRLSHFRFLFTRHVKYQHPPKPKLAHRQSRFPPKFIPDAEKRATLIEMWFSLSVAVEPSIHPSNAICFGVFVRRVDSLPEPHRQTQSDRQTVSQSDSDTADGSFQLQPYAVNFYQHQTNERKSHNSSDLESLWHYAMWQRQTPGRARKSSRTSSRSCRATQPRSASAGWLTVNPRINSVCVRVCL